MDDFVNVWFDEEPQKPDDMLTLAKIRQVIDDLKNPPPREPLQILSLDELAEGFEQSLKAFHDTYRAEQRRKAAQAPVHWAVRRLLADL